jgi:hypothetical protein
MTMKSKGIFNLIDLILKYVLFIDIFSRDKIVSQVLEEIGIELTGALAGLYLFINLLAIILFLFNGAILF